MVYEITVTHGLIAKSVKTDGGNGITGNDDRSKTYYRVDFENRSEIEAIRFIDFKRMPFCVSNS